ncbi:hypothetical protein SCNU_19767 [Gordonia neofelifaecis NRRL B-59395]|uniref:Uncharacterized protein n=1 Tax=Gordonia neofelifaecis NRRL B-59395 TaxID=644548 RepID=F1YPT9_9ACTN|nr:hypothetical protein SCNU_19767 [Gordonia neofelifaecis NRRL B-59395]
MLCDRAIDRIGTDLGIRVVVRGKFPRTTRPAPEIRTRFGTFPSVRES